MTLAEQALWRFHSSEIYVAWPYAERGAWDYYEIQQSEFFLTEVKRALGVKLIGDFGDDRSEELLLQVGGNAVAGFYADKIRDYEQALALWMAGDWDALREAGMVSEEGYRELKEDFPDGPPGE